MSVTELEQLVQALPPDDLAQFSQWFDTYRDATRPPDTDNDQEDYLTEEQRAEILRRVQLANDHPELLEPWEGTSDRVRERLHELRRQKAQVR